MKVPPLQYINKVIDVPVVMRRPDPISQTVQKTTVPQCIDKAEDMSGLMQRQIPLIQRVQKTVEVPRVQFIDRVVDDPAVMQRQASTIEARDSQDYPRDPRRDSAGEQADEVPDTTPFGKANCTKKSRTAEGQDQDVDVERFSDSALPFSQPSLERKVFCASMASSDEEVEEPAQEQVRSLVQGGEHRGKEDETDARGPGSDLVQVAPNMEAGGSHPQAMMEQEWAKELREIRWMVEFVVHRERKLDVKTDQPEGWRGWKERDPNSKTRSVKTASKKPSLTTPKS